MSRILVVDDDGDMLALLQNVLKKDGHQVTALQSGLLVEEDKLSSYDMMILDVMMPEVDGFQLCKRIRGLVSCPIIFLSARTDEMSVVEGLGVGGDDYLLKPFGIGELRSRVQAHLRREQRESYTPVNCSGLSFRFSNREVWCGEEKIPLTKSEYDICEYLVRNRGQVFTKERIYEAVFGYDGESELSAITEHVKNIRAKLKPFGVTPIGTVWGVGYKWE